MDPESAIPEPAPVATFEDVMAWRKRFIQRTNGIPTSADMRAELPAEVVDAFEVEIAARKAGRARRDIEAAASLARMSCELDDARRANLLAQAEIPPRYAGVTFAALDDRCPTAKADAEAYCAAPFELHGRDSLLVMGPPGTGKTALAVACLRQALDDRLEPIRFAHLGHYLDRLRDPKDEEVQSVHALATGYQLVALDELGRQRLTEWGQEQVHLLVDAIYAGKRKAVLTTNLTWRQWTDTMDEAIRSRCREMCQVVTLVGSDRR